MEPYELRRGAYKTLTLRLLPPRGDVRVTAPWFVPRWLVDRFVASRTEWIAERRRRWPVDLRSGGDSVRVWGQQLPLRIESPGKLPRVKWEPGDDEVVLRVPASWTPNQRQKALDRWECTRVTEALQTLIPRWEATTGLSVGRWQVKRLRSRWGSCRPDTRSLVFNSRLGAFPPRCLEHVVVHELAHLVEPHHNRRFHGLVDSWLPGAQEIRDLLRRGPDAE